MGMSEMSRRFLQDQSGATAIEYGLIAAGISLGIISTLATMKDKLIATFAAVQAALQ